MSWEKIKTILIVLFLFTDLFLAASITASRKKAVEISPDVINSAVQILSEHNISIDNSVIPAKISAASLMQADNVIPDYESFARIVLGDNFYQDEEGAFCKDDAKLTFSGDKFFLNMLKTPSASDNYTQSDAKKSAFSYLEKLGFKTSGAKIVSSSKAGGVYQLKIRDYYENKPIFSSEAIVSVSKEGIISISGSWFNRRDGASSYTFLKSAPSLLVEFASAYPGDAHLEITEIEYGYSIFDSETYHKSASLIPVTKISANNGHDYFLDARAEQ